MVSLLPTCEQSTRAWLGPAWHAGWRTRCHVLPHELTAQYVVALQKLPLIANSAEQKHGWDTDLGMCSRQAAMASATTRTPVQPQIALLPAQHRQVMTARQVHPAQVEIQVRPGCCLSHQAPNSACSHALTAHLQKSLTEYQIGGAGQVNWLVALMSHRSLDLTAKSNIMQPARICALICSDNCYPAALGCVLWLIFLAMGTSA